MKVIASLVTFALLAVAAPVSALHAEDHLDPRPEFHVLTFVRQADVFVEYAAGWYDPQGTTESSNDCFADRFYREHTSFEYYDQGRVYVDAGIWGTGTLATGLPVTSDPQLVGEEYCLAVLADDTKPPQEIGVTDTDYDIGFKADVVGITSGYSTVERWIYDSSADRQADFWWKVFACPIDAVTIEARGTSSPVFSTWDTWGLIASPYTQQPIQMGFKAHADATDCAARDVSSMLRPFAAADRMGTTIELLDLADVGANMAGGESYVLISCMSVPATWATTIEEATFVSHDWFTVAGQDGGVVDADAVQWGLNPDHIYGQQSNNGCPITGDEWVSDVFLG